MVHHQLDNGSSSLNSSVVTLSDVRLGARVRQASSSSPVLVGLSASSASQQEGVFTSWGSSGQLIEGENLSTSADDSSSGGSRESEGTDLQSLWNGGESFVIEDGADDHDGSLLILGEVLQDSRDRDRESVVQALVESLVNDFVES